MAAKFISIGHEVMIGTRDVTESLTRTENDRYGNPGFGNWIKSNPAVKVGTIAEAAAFGEILVNATQGASSVSTFKAADARHLDGKVIIDVANPLDFSKGMPPGLIPELSNFNSVGEEMQKNFPQARIVKTFNTMWCGLMVNPQMIGNGEHLNFLSGNDAEAKAKVRSLLKEMGWKDESLSILEILLCTWDRRPCSRLWIRLMNLKQTAAFNFRIVG